MLYDVIERYDNMIQMNRGYEVFKNFISLYQKSQKFSNN